MPDIIEQHRSALCSACLRKDSNLILCFLTRTLQDPQIKYSTLLLWLFLKSRIMCAFLNSTVDTDIRIFIRGRLPYSLRITEYFFKTEWNVRVTLTKRAGTGRRIPLVWCWASLALWRAWSFAPFSPNSSLRSLELLLWNSPFIVFLFFGRHNHIFLCSCQDWP